MRSQVDDSEVTIRRATAKDARLLSALATVTFFEAYFEQDDPHDLADYLIDSFSPEAISEDLESMTSAYFVVMRDGHAVGYAKLRDDQPHESVGENAIELQRFYLVERVWGSGVGRVLLDHCIAEARSVGKEVLWLGVWEENARGLSFYRKHGFERVGTLTFPYGDTVGINAVMQIPI
ncbi:MAG TPA: GNAT family N-acetyltransferase [Pyrinomonadaceae bacterium]